MRKINIIYLMLLLGECTSGARGVDRPHYEQAIGHLKRRSTARTDSFSYDGPKVVLIPTPAVHRQANGGVRVAETRARPATAPASRSHVRQPIPTPQTTNRSGPSATSGQFGFRSAHTVPIPNRSRPGQFVRNAHTTPQTTNRSGPSATSGQFGFRSAQARPRSADPRYLVPQLKESYEHLLENYRALDAQESYERLLANYRDLLSILEQTPPEGAPPTTLSGFSASSSSGLGSSARPQAMTPSAGRWPAGQRPPVGHVPTVGRHQSTSTPASSPSRTSGSSVLGGVRSSGSSSGSSGSSPGVVSASGASGARISSISTNNPLYHLLPGPDLFQQSDDILQQIIPRLMSVTRPECIKLLRDYLRQVFATTDCKFLHDAPLTAQGSSVQIVRQYLNKHKEHFQFTGDFTDVYQQIYQLPIVSEDDRKVILQALKQQLEACANTLRPQADVSSNKTYVQPAANNWEFRTKFSLQQPDLCIRIQRIPYAAMVVIHLQIPVVGKRSTINAKVVWKKPEAVSSVGTPPEPAAGRQDADTVRSEDAVQARAAQVSSGEAFLDGVTAMRSQAEVMRLQHENSKLVSILKDLDETRQAYREVTKEVDELNATTSQADSEIGYLADNLANPMGKREDLQEKQELEDLLEKGRTLQRDLLNKGRDWSTKDIHYDLLQQKMALIQRVRAYLDERDLQLVENEENFDSSGMLELYKKAAEIAKSRIVSIAQDEMKFKTPLIAELEKLRTANAANKNTLSIRKIAQAGAHKKHNIKLAEAKKFKQEYETQLNPLEAGLRLDVMVDLIYRLEQKPKEINDLDDQINELYRQKMAQPEGSSDAGIQSKIDELTASLNTLKKSIIDDIKVKIQAGTLDPNAEWDLAKFEITDDAVQSAGAASADGTSEELDVGLLAKFMARR